MLKEVHAHARRAGQSPGLLVRAEKHPQPTTIRVINYTATAAEEIEDSGVDAAIAPIPPNATRWIQVEGFEDIERITAIQKAYRIHDLTMEDILVSAQRAKTEEFENYIFVTLKILLVKKNSRRFHIHQMNLILGENFVISLSNKPFHIFSIIRTKLTDNPSQRLREQKADYLFYRLIDTIIDQYFVVLEEIGEKIDRLETLIIDLPDRTHTRTLYRLKRNTLTLRKAIWPIREAVNHLSEVDEKFIRKFTRTYLRDVYDHAMQTIDTIETYRDMLSSMLDIYLSSMTNHLNQVMKTLTVIATIFIPITFIASLYGMNFIDMPELKWHYGYPYALGLMATSIILMIIYFRKKKWF